MKLGIIFAVSVIGGMMIFLPMSLVDAKPEKPELIFFDWDLNADDQGSLTGKAHYYNPSAVSSFQLHNLQVKVDTNPEKGGTQAIKVDLSGDNFSIGPEDTKILGVPFQDVFGDDINPDSPFQIILRGMNEDTHKGFTTRDRADCQDGIFNPCILK